jgi:hypothetical protein
LELYKEDVPIYLFVCLKKYKTIVKVQASWIGIARSVGVKAQIYLYVDLSTCIALMHPLDLERTGMTRQNLL